MRFVWVSGDGPGVGSVEEGLEVAGCGVFGGGDLFAGLVVVGGAVDLADDAHDGVGQVVAGQVGQGVGVGGVVGVGVVDDDVGLVHVGGGGDGQGAAVAHDAVLSLVAAGDLLALANGIDVVGGVFLAEDVEGAVVEDGAVLHDRHEAGAAVVGGGFAHLGQSLAVRVQGAGDEGAFGSQCQ